MFEKGKNRQKVSLVEVAKLAGVSPITVSRALNNPGIVSEKTRKAVQRAVEKTGYVANPFASNLRSGSSSFLAVFVDNTQNTQFMNAVKGCTDALSDLNLRLLLSETGYSADKEQKAVDSVIPFKPAAMVFVGLIRSEVTRSRLSDLAIPTVEMWDFSPMPVDMLVGFSNVEGGRLMGRHFCSKKYGRSAYVGRIDGREGQRLSGFKEELLRNGQDAEFLLPLEHTDEISDGKHAIEALLDAFPACESAFFATDMLALGALFECRSRGIAVPQRLAITGFGDIGISSLLSSPLTTVRVPDYELGTAAGELIAARLAGKTFKKSTLFDLELRVRATG